MVEVKEKEKIAVSSTEFYKALGVMTRALEIRDIEKLKEYLRINLKEMNEINTRTD